MNLVERQFEALVRDVPLSRTFWAGVIGLVTAAVTTLAARAVRGWRVRRGRADGTPEISPLPGRFAARIISGIAAALRDWRHARGLAGPRGPVCADRGVLDHSADRLRHPEPRPWPCSGHLGANLVTIAVAVVAPDWVLVGSPWSPVWPTCCAASS